MLLVVWTISIVLVMHSTVLVSSLGHSMESLGIVGDRIFTSGLGSVTILFISASIISERLSLTSFSMGGLSVPIAVVFIFAVVWVLWWGTTIGSLGLLGWADGLLLRAMAA